MKIKNIKIKKPLELVTVKDGYGDNPRDAHSIDGTAAALVSQD